jgi:hypothetical protein
MAIVVCGHMVEGPDKIMINLPIIRAPIKPKGCPDNAGPEPWQAAMSGKSWPPPTGNHWRFGAQPSSDKDAPTHPRAAIIGSEPGNMRSCGRKGDGRYASPTDARGLGACTSVYLSGGRTRTSAASCHVARTSADEVVWWSPPVASRLGAGSGGRCTPRPPLAAQITGQGEVPAAPASPPTHRRHRGTRARVLVKPEGRR